MFYSKMRALKRWSEDFLLLWALAICLMLSGGHCYSQSMSCSMVEGRTICETRKGDGNTAAAFSRASHGQSGAFQDAKAITGTSPFDGYGFSNFHPNNNGRLNINTQNLAGTGVTKTESNTAINGPGPNIGVNRNAFTATSKSIGFLGSGAIPLGGYENSYIHPKNNGGWNINSNGLTGAAVSEAERNGANAKIASPGINTDGFAVTSYTSEIPGRVYSGTLPRAENEVRNLHSNNNDPWNFNTNDVSDADVSGVRKIDTSTGIASPNVSPGISTGSFAGTVNNHENPGRPHSGGTFPLGGYKVPNIYPNNNGHWNINANGVNNVDVSEGKMTGTSTGFAGLNGNPGINANIFAGTSNMHGIPGLPYRGTFLHREYGFPNFHQNNNDRQNTNADGLSNDHISEVRKTDTNTRAAGLDGSSGINTDAYPGNRINHGISKPAYIGGTFPIPNIGFSNIYPNNNGRWNHDNNGVGNADVNEVRKTGSGTGFGDPKGSSRMKIDGFVTTSNIQGFLRPVYRDGVLPFGGHGVHNTHSNKNGGWNINADKLPVPGVSEARTDANTRNVVPNGIATNGFDNVLKTPGPSYGGFAVPNFGNLNGNNPFAVVDDVFRNAGLGPAFPWNGFGKKR